MARNPTSIDLIRAKFPNSRVKSMGVYHNEDNRRKQRFFPVLGEVDAKDNYDLICWGSEKCQCVKCSEKAVVALDTITT